jgi:hypothetical protein
MSRWLERLVGAACLVAIAYSIVATVVAVRHLPPRRPSTNPAVAPKVAPTIEIGTRFGALPDSLLPAHRKLLVLALREDCVYCQQSLPLYRSLSQMARQSEALFSLVVIGGEPAERLTEYLQSEGIEAAAVLEVPLQKHVTGTPTIVLCDQNGDVQQVWTGLLAKEMELTVVDAVTAQSRGVGESRW